MPYLVTVSVGGTQLINEPVHSEADALDEALYLLDDFVFRGWATEIYRDPRLAGAPPNYPDLAHD